MDDQSIQDLIQDLARWLDDDPDGQAKTAGAARRREKLLAAQGRIHERLRTAEEELGVQKKALADAQRSIAEERRHYQELFEFAPDGYLVTNADGMILEANRAAGDLFAVPPETLPGKTLVQYVGRNERKIFISYLNRFKKGKKIRGWETTLQPAGGNSFPAILMVAGVHQAGQLSGLRWFIHDSRPRKQMEEALRRESASVILLKEVAETANQAQNMEESMRFALEKVCSYTGWPLGHVYLRDAARPDKLLSTNLWYGDEDRFSAFREFTEKTDMEIGSGLPGLVLENRKPEWLANIQKNRVSLRGTEAQSAGIQSTFAFPAFVGEEVAAVLEFFSTEVCEPDEAILEIMCHIGTQIGRVIERHQAEEALRQSEARFRAVFEESALGIKLLDLDGRILESNPALQEMLGYNGDELRRMNFTGLTYPEDIEKSRELFHSLIVGENEHYRIEKRYLRKDSSLVWARFTGSLVCNPDGTPQFILGLVENISERKQIEAELSEVQRRLIESGEAERLNLAQELHDGPMQDLYGVTYQLTGLQNLSAEPEWQSKFSVVLGSLQQVIQVLRETCGELRPPTLTPFGLEKAIRSHAEFFKSRNPELDIHLDLAPDGQSLPEPTRMALFRIYQQLLANVVRHANASRVDVRLVLDEDRVVLEVKDNGQGFAVPDRWIQLVRQGHLGLAGAAERAEAVGGRLKVESVLDRGTSVRVTVPRAAGRG